MSFRRHLITGERILFAPERAARPHAFLDDPAPQRCPFCPGHEADTPPPLLTIGDPWHIRVVPNKYPSVEGAEVIIESPRHEDAFADVVHANDVVDAYVKRYAAHQEAACISLFRNDGPQAGASIPHVHSQLIPLPFVPPRIALESAAFGAASACPVCAAIETHRREGLLIAESEAFAWLAPSASAMPWQQWIVPKRHMPEIAGMSVPERMELGPMLRRTAAATLTISRSFNWSFLNFRRQPSAHWYAELFPRVTTLAGFELATGTFIEIIDPATAAERLRQSDASTP